MTYYTLNRARLKIVEKYPRLMYNPSDLNRKIYEEQELGNG